MIRKSIFGAIVALAVLAGFVLVGGCGTDAATDKVTVKGAAN